MKILVAEDDNSMLKGIETFLRTQNHLVVGVLNGEAALEKCRQEHFDLVISDMQMPGMTGLELLIQMHELSIEIPFIIITAYASVEDAVLAMKNGADDYLTKPLNLQELTLKIQKIQHSILLKRENEQLKKRLNNLEFPGMVGVSAPIQKVQRLIQKVADDPDVAVIIYGESGTGKELVARNIHNLSARANKPFVPVNCAAFPNDILESELFGHKRGAFTGAYQDRQGLFQAAHQGTLFLDEVSEMSPQMQAKLLRVIQEQTIQPVGSVKQIKVDVRVISASNKNLTDMVNSGDFREDLYYRLHVVEIHIAPLRERQDDIPLLLHHFLTLQNEKRQSAVRFSSDALDILNEYTWPGNVRELENLVRRLFVTSDNLVITKDDLPGKILDHVISPRGQWELLIRQPDYKTALNHIIRDFEKEFIGYHLKKNRGNISKTAESIGLSRVALHKKIKDYQLEP